VEAGFHVTATGSMKAGGVHDGGGGRQNRGHPVTNPRDGMGRHRSRHRSVTDEHA
jgi:hypothetical protein